MPTNEKFLDKEGVRALWEEAYGSFAEKTGYELAKAEIEANIESMQSDISDLKNAGTDQETLDRISALEANDAGEEERINAAIAKVVDSAPEAFDTLKEVADYIAEDKEGAADMVGRISALENAEIESLSKAEVKDICKRVYDEIVLNKYIVADKDEALRAIANISGNGSITLGGLRSSYFFFFISILISLIDSNCFLNKIKICFGESKCFSFSKTKPI